VFAVRKSTVRSTVHNGHRVADSGGESVGAAEPPASSSRRCRTETSDVRNGLTTPVGSASSRAEYSVSLALVRRPWWISRAVSSSLTSSGVVGQSIGRHVCHRVRSVSVCGARIQDARAAVGMDGMRPVSVRASPGLGDGHVRGENDHSLGADEMRIVPAPPETILYGAVTDQEHLHGILMFPGEPRSAARGRAATADRTGRSHLTPVSSDVISSRRGGCHVCRGSGV
jgi:hypothetical protein